MTEGMFSGFDKKEEPYDLDILNELNEYSPHVYRLAGGIMLFNVILNIIFTAYFGRVNLFIPIFDVIILIGLFRLSDSFRSFAVLRAFLGILIYPIYMFFTMGLNLNSIITTILQILYCVPIILLLYGKEKKKKTIFAMVIFGFYVLMMVIIFIGIIINKKQIYW